MRSRLHALSPAAALIALAGCAVVKNATVLSAEKEALADKSISVAVLDVFDDSGAVDPLVMVMTLTRQLFVSGYRNARTEAFRTIHRAWTPAEAAKIARRGQDPPTLMEYLGSEERSDPAPSAFTGHPN